MAGHNLEIMNMVPKFVKRAFERALAYENL